MLARISCCFALFAAVAFAQSPSITSLNPSSAQRGSSATPLSISGQNITSDSQVSWTTPDGRTIKLSPSLVQAAQVAATIPTVLLSTAGTAQVGLVNGAGVLSNQLPFQITSFRITTASFPGGTVGASYGPVTITATDGVTPYTFAATGGALPAGLSLDPSGVLSGIPTAPGTSQFAITVTDRAGKKAVSSFLLSVAPLPLTFTTGGVLPSGLTTIDYPDQILVAAGGVAPYRFSLTGGSLPSGLTLVNGVISGTPVAAGTSTFILTVTDSASPASTATLAASLTVRLVASDLVLQSSTAQFALTSGAATLPPASGIAVGASISSTILNYTATVTPSVPWLTVRSGSTTPSSINVALTSQALSLAAATTPYTASVVAACVAPSPCAGSSQTINVSLTVNAVQPQLAVSTDVMSFVGSSVTPQAVTEDLSLQNVGGGSLGITSITSADSFLTVGDYPASLTAGQSAVVTITADPSKLKAGYYRSSILVVTSGGRATIPVSFDVEGAPAITLAPAGVQYTETAGGGVGNPNGSFRVAVSTAASTSFTASVVSGASWLTLRTNGGTASSANPATVSYSIDPRGAAALGIGAAYGQIRISGPAILNSPQDFEVVLNVAAPTSRLLPDLQPAGLLFLSSSPGKLPVQSVLVAASSTASASYQASAATTDGGKWLSVTPTTGTTVAGSPATSSVGVDTTGLAAGVYTGGVSYEYSGSSVRTVNVTVIVSSSTGSGTASRTIQATGCTPTKIVPTQTGIVSNFSAPASWPTALAIQLANDCGAIIGNGQVVTTFSNTDPPLILSPTDSTNGVYSATWTPRKTGAQVTINATASAPGLPSATISITGQVKPNAAPVVVPHGTTNIFSPQVGGPLAPGTVIQIYGSNLASQETIPTTLPLPLTASGTSVLIGGVQAPLFYAAPGQINAQVPYELAPGHQYDVIVNANGAYSTPDPINVEASAPGVLQYPLGTTLAQHSADNSFVTESSPAKPGEYVTVYVLGMGQLSVPVASGAGAPGLNPGDTLASTQGATTVTVGGGSSNVYFAGLTPGLVGLYQVTFQVPSDAAAGDLPVVISTAGAADATGLIPVGN